MSSSPSQKASCAPATESESKDTAVETVQTDELVALLKAIKFKYPEYGVKRVHQQVLTHGGKWSTVNIKRVRKHLKKLGLCGSLEADVDEKPISMMTIGGESKSSRTPTASTAESEFDESTNDWLPVKLDVPAMDTSRVPYQSTISFWKSDMGASDGKKGEIFKIQTAVPVPGFANPPMLLYNKARNRKTFIQPHCPAFNAIQNFIKKDGIVGVGQGKKAYFWGQYKDNVDMLFINVAELAPAQEW